MPIPQASLTAVALAALALAGCRVDTKGIGDAGGGGAGDVSGDRVNDAPSLADGPSSETPGEDDTGNGMGPGAECTTGIECLSGACSEGICCDSTCTGDCEACNVAGSVGT